MPEPLHQTASELLILPGCGKFVLKAADGLLEYIISHSVNYSAGKLSPRTVSSRRLEKGDRKLRGRWGQKERMGG